MILVIDTPWDPALDVPVTVCLGHMRFIPCRGKPAGACVWSSDPADVEAVRRYQAGTG